MNTLQVEQLQEDIKSNVHGLSVHLHLSTGSTLGSTWNSMFFFRSKTNAEVEVKIRKREAIEQYGRSTLVGFHSRKYIVSPEPPKRLWEMADLLLSKPFRSAKGQHAVAKSLMRRTFRFGIDILRLSRMTSRRRPFTRPPCCRAWNVRTVRAPSSDSEDVLKHCPSHVL